MKIICLNDNEGKDGITFYRAIQPLRYLQSKGHTVLYKTDIQNKDGSVKSETMIDVDIVWISSPNGKTTLDMIKSILKTNLIEQTMVQYGVPKEEMQKQGLSTKILKIVIDYDDDLMTHNPTNRAYGMRGRKEVTFINKQGKKEYIWKNGKEYPTLEGILKKFDTKENYDNIKSQIEILRVADLFTTPNTKLKNRLGRFVTSEDKYLLPNAIDINKFKYNNWKDTNEYRLLWTLSESHLYEWLHIYPILGRVMKKYPNLKLVTVGAKFPVAKRQLPLSQWEYHKWVDIDKYGDFLSSLKCNLGLAYVKQDKFNHFKSPIKWEEYSSMGICTLSSEYLYGNYIPKDCSVVYSNDTDFEQKLSDICEGKIEIKQIAMNAYKEIRENYRLNIVGDRLEQRLIELTKDNDLYAKIQTDEQRSEVAFHSV